MDLKLFENQGQLKVSNREGTKPLAKVYVKVYARLADGSVKFHKDGYTDLRGRFDYATVSTPEKQGITRFSVLVLSEDQGATIRETNPPQR
jgi:acyl-CoA-binding protein